MKKLSLVLPLLFAVGCGGWSSYPPTAPKTAQTSASSATETNDNTTSDSGEETPGKPEDLAKSKAATAEVTLIDDDGTEFKNFVAANKGKVILVDGWATWCGPCKEGFPSTVALHEKYKGEGLVVVSVSFDDMGEDDEEKKTNRDAALDFLKKQKATFKNFLATTGVGPESGTPFGVNIQLPAYRVIDRQGKDRLEEVKGKEADEVIPGLVEKLLKEAP